MNNNTAKCSTPMYEHNHIHLDFTLSEIRREKITLQNGLQLENSVIAPHSKKQSKQSHRLKDIQKKDHHKSKKMVIQFEDSDSDSNGYETVEDTSSPNTSHYPIDTQSINYTEIQSTEHDHSALLSPEIFSSSSGSDKCLKRYLNTLRNNKTESSIPVIDDFPMLQLTREDPRNLKFYSGPHPEGKKNVSPSEISFSPKWEYRVPSKYKSPSDIPSRNDTLSKLSEEIGKRDSSKEIVRSKYSHLRVQSQQFKRLLSPTRKLSTTSEKENVFNRHRDSQDGRGASKSKKGESKRELEFYDTGEIAVSTLRHSKSTTKKRAGNVNFENQSLDTSGDFKENNLSKNKSTVTIKSKLMVSSIEILEKPLNINLN